MNIQTTLRRHRALDQQRRREALPLEQVRRRSCQERRHHPVRSRFVDGVAADLRSRCTGTPGFVSDGVVREARLRLLVRGHGRLRPLDQRSRQQRADIVRRGRLSCRRALTSRNCAAIAACSSMASRPARCALRCLPSVIPKWWIVSPSTRRCGPAKIRRRFMSGARSCPNISRGTVGRLTASLSIRSSTATTPAAPTIA